MFSTACRGPSSLRGVARMCQDRPSLRVISAAVAHFLHTEGVTGSIPVSPTTQGLPREALIHFPDFLIFPSLKTAPSSASNSTSPRDASITPRLAPRTPTRAAHPGRVGARIYVRQRAKMRFPTSAAGATASNAENRIERGTSSRGQPSFLCSFLVALQLRLQRT